MAMIPRFIKRSMSTISFSSIIQLQSYTGTEICNRICIYKFIFTFTIMCSFYVNIRGKYIPVLIKYYYGMTYWGVKL